MVWPQGGPLSMVLASVCNGQRGEHQLFNGQQRRPRRCNGMWNSDNPVFAVLMRADPDANGVGNVVESRRRSRRGMRCDQFPPAVGVLFDYRSINYATGVADEQERFSRQ